MTRRTVFLLLVPLALLFPVLPAHAQPTLAYDKAAAAWKLPWDADWVTAVAFLGNGRVAAGNNLGQILVWDLPAKTGDPVPAPIWRLDGHSNVINRLVATPDGRWLISASSDHTVRYWDMLAVSDKTDTVVLNARAIDEAKVKKMKLPTAVEAKVQVHMAEKTLKAHKDWVLGLALSADGKTLVSGDDKGEVIVWDRPAGTELRRWKVKGWAWALALTPDASSLIVSERFPSVFDKSRHTGLKLWDPQIGKMKLDLAKTFDKQMISATAFSPDGKWLAVARGGEIDGQNGKATLLNAASGEKVRELSPGHLNGATDLVFSPDSKHLFSSGRDTLVRVWQVADGKMLKELGTPRGGQSKDWIHAVAVSPDARWLAAADMAGLVQIWTFPMADQPPPAKSK